jgi:hypothetical protein
MLKKMHTTVPTGMGKYNSSDDDDYTESSLGASLDKDDELIATTSTQGRDAKAEPKKKRPPTKRGRMTMAKSERKRMAARIAKSSDGRAPTQTPPTTSVS